MANQNLELLKVAAKLLEPVLDELVFVGGCATALLVSDEAAPEVRPTWTQPKNMRSNKTFAFAL